MCELRAGIGVLAEETEEEKEDEGESGKIKRRTEMKSTSHTFHLTRIHTYVDLYTYKNTPLLQNKP